jgi:mannose/cellobiose epimerase-like protein (N-acyl-D-glucosamine 2-epimerase family)
MNSLTEKKVRCYFNLHKNLFSIQLQIEDVVNGKKRKSWKVVAHTNCVLLKNVEFRVYESGRQRVIKEKRKNVHAYVYGTWTNKVPGILETIVSYNPYKQGNFYYKDTEYPCFIADSAVLCLRECNKPEIRVNG